VRKENQRNNYLKCFSYLDFLIILRGTNRMKKSILFIIFILTVSSIIPTVSVSLTSQKECLNIEKMLIDYDPLVDVYLNFNLLGILALDSIDDSSDPDFYVRVVIEDEEFISPTFYDCKFVYNCWSFTKDIDDYIDILNISIELFDKELSGDRLCDISQNKNNQDQGYGVKIFYDLKTGRWSGDDYINDKSGYGRLNGCDDGSIYTNERDCEILFNINQTDFDGDGLPYYIENFIYYTNPMIDNTGEDMDNDNIPIEWEHKWGFNPFIWDNHTFLDNDNDSLTNFEEYLTKDFNSDPFRKDIFLEIDYMQEATGEIPMINKSAFEILKQPFHRRNIVFHFDSGEINGGEVISYDEKSDFEEVIDIWRNYFLNNDTQNSRRGVFHYAVFVHDQFPKGFAFSGDIAPYWGYLPGTNSFVIANTLVEKKTRTLFKSNDTIYASLIMHEMGHNFGIRRGNPGGCDNQFTKNPFGLGWYIWRNYKSIMNYRYTYSILDYSNGSHGKRDYNDWDAIDLSYFEIPDVPNFLN
jgi:hypothetical protein